MKKEPAIKKEKVVKQISNIHTALFDFQCENIVLPRNGTGVIKEKSYKYCTLDDLINIIREPLKKNGMGFTQLVQNEKMVTLLFHPESGTSVQSEIMLGNPVQMQDYGARITYARRYSLTALLGLSTEEDIDSSTVTTQEKKAPEIKTGTEAFNKAKGAIESAKTEEAITLIKEQIKKSERLTNEEKAELLK